MPDTIIDQEVSELLQSPGWRYVQNAARARRTIVLGRMARHRYTTLEELARDQAEVIALDTFCSAEALQEFVRRHQPN